MRRSIIALLGLVALSTSACQKPDLAERKQRTEDQVCAQLRAVGQALDQVAALRPTSTVGEAAAADKALGTALEALQASEKKLEKLRLQSFQDQLKSFKGQVSQVTSNKKLTLEEAANELRTKAQPVIAARRQLSATVKCSEIPQPAAKP
ncbi:hypothetical protein KBZ20_10115 [Vulcanococcus limneticus Candia 3F8]|uniref:hypothetical protein n=1 Tax=Vulcanococcus limneticus TaxID=2170428 RepID=UPI0012FF9B6F|nr:hypothetical protein [Vulcanococcus limneticus]MCP9792443.1 hypothetical protein [Vulcanococcus limneticus MW73D5]MCP9894124.1 hypothetical protein [Vulcanococcus limneticus Candia 3F8]MCP9897833.1 hypothetical protein [Vulcanococcus limneticus Candia 3B3]